MRFSSSHTFFSKIIHALMILALTFSFSYCSKKKEETSTGGKESTDDGKTPGDKTKTDGTNETGKENPEQRSDKLLKNSNLPKIFPTFLTKNLDKATTDEKALIKAIQEDQAIPFELVTKIFVQNELNFYEGLKKPLKITEATPSFEDFWKKLGEINSDIKEANDLHQFKIEMEDAIGGIETYNKNYRSMPNVILQRKLQCLSGTTTFEVMNRIHFEEKKYFEKNRVVLMTCGHIQPGYLEKDKDGDWNLIGIETTSQGRAKVIKGKVKNLKSKIRILDANMWMIVAILSKFIDGSKFLEIDKLLIEATNDLYGQQIPVKELEDKIKNEPCSTSGESFGGDVSAEPDTESNLYPGGFGAANVPPGDTQRNESDEIDESETGSLNDAASAPLPPGGTTSDPKEFQPERVDQSKHFTTYKIQATPSPIPGKCLVHENSATGIKPIKDLLPTSFNLSCPGQDHDDENYDDSDTEGPFIGHEKDMVCAEFEKNFSDTEPNSNLGSMNSKYLITSGLIPQSIHSWNLPVDEITISASTKANASLTDDKSGAKHNVIQLAFNQTHLGSETAKVICFWEYSFTVEKVQ